MDAAINNISYKYRAPLRYILFAVTFMCLGGLAAFFFAVISQWIFKAIILFFMSVSFAGGIGFLTDFLCNISRQIIFTQDTVILPYRDKKRYVALDYSDISVSNEKRYYGRIMKITTNDDRSFILDENWMRKGDFDEILTLLKSKTE